MTINNDDKNIDDIEVKCIPDESEILMKFGNPKIENLLGKLVKPPELYMLSDY